MSKIVLNCPRLSQIPLDCFKLSEIVLRYSTLSHYCPHIGYSRLFLNSNFLNFIVTRIANFKRIAVRSSSGNDTSFLNILARLRAPPTPSLLQLYAILPRKLVLRSHGLIKVPFYRCFADIKRGPRRFLKARRTKYCALGVLEAGVGSGEGSSYAEPGFTRPGVGTPPFYRFVQLRKYINP